MAADGPGPLCALHLHRAVHPRRRPARQAISLSLTVLGVSGLLGIWIAGLTVDSPPAPFAPDYPSDYRRLDAPAALCRWQPSPCAGADDEGARLGAVGIYNQSAILRAGSENKDAANRITVLTVQLGIPIGAPWAPPPLVVAGPLLEPTDAVLPVLAALLVTLGGRKAAYPGPRESVWKTPRPVEEHRGTAARK
ncbi:hypothetical protein ACLKOZ_01330 [Arthrobacter sp. R4]|uniref:hypothetical protein n=1 Tax=Arthrobacter sp. R4 TaxID=644417 RepID=UPI003ED8E897